MTLLHEPDYGTPAKTGPQVTVTIDDTAVQVGAGTSVLRAASEAGIDIPRLCATDSVEAFGSCRLCVVEVEGVRTVPASCTTPCVDGMVVRTRTERVDHVRKGVVELYLSDHPAECTGSEAETGCQMHDLAERVGLDGVRYGRDGANHLDAPVDESNPYFRFDPAACIVCSRCVRACSEVQGTFALTIQANGFRSMVSAGGRFSTT